MNSLIAIGAIAGLVITVKLLQQPDFAEASLAAHPNPIIPDDPLQAPTYGFYTDFPDTGYLHIKPRIWRSANELTALFREGERYSIRDFIQPAQVSQFSFPEDPVDVAISKMFLRTIEVPYVLDTQYYDFWQQPSETLVSGGDCEDTAFMLASMMLNRDIEVYLVAGYYVEGEWFGHAWVEARLPGKGHFLFETTLDYPPNNLWVEVHNNPIAQFYVPVLYWNLNDIWVEGDSYKNLLSNSSLGVHIPAYNKIFLPEQLGMKHEDQEERRRRPQRTPPGLDASAAEQENQERKVYRIRDMWRTLN